MGKRSRRAEQAARAANPPPEPIRGSGRRARQARLKRRAGAASAQAEKLIRQRPPAPWDPFPLTELAIFFGLVLFVAGINFGTKSTTGIVLTVSGVIFVCIGGLETMLREHLAGYRSHAGVLAGVLALVALALSTALLKVGFFVRAAIVLGVFATIYPALRRDFVRRHAQGQYGAAK